MNEEHRNDRIQLVQQAPTCFKAQCFQLHAPEAQDHEPRCCQTCKKKEYKTRRITVGTHSTPITGEIFKQLGDIFIATKTEVQITGTALHKLTQLEKLEKLCINLTFTS